VFVRATKLSIILLLTLSLGLQWGALQLIAWTSMVVRYARSAPIEVALAKTFDGNHPCCLCRMVAKGRAAERKQAAGLNTHKLDPGLLPASSPESPRAFSRLAWRPVAFQGTPRAESPPVPPPRLTPYSRL
jgi:hypothetical protein